MGEVLFSARFSLTSIFMCQSFWRNNFDFVDIAGRDLGKKNLNILLVEHLHVERAGLFLLLF